MNLRIHALHCSPYGELTPIGTASVAVKIQSAEDAYEEYVSVVRADPNFKAGAGTGMDDFVFARVQVGDEDTFHSARASTRRIGRAT